MTRVVQNRHEKRQNVVFADNTVRTVDLKQMWKLKWDRQFDTNGDWTTGGSKADAWPAWMEGFKDY